MNEMECFSKINVKDVKFLKPVYSCTYQRLKEPTLTSSLKESFQTIDSHLKCLSFGDLSFLCVTSFGMLKLFKFDNYTGEWSFNEIDLGDIYVDKCDFISMKDFVYIVCVEHKSLQVHVFQWDLVSIKIKNHFRFYVKNETFDVEIHEIQFSIFGDLYISTNRSVQKWILSDNLWMLSSTVSKGGNMRVTKAYVYLLSENLEKYNFDLSLVSSTSEKIKNEKSFDLSVSPNDICVGLLKYCENKFNFTVYMERDVAIAQSINSLIHCIVNKFEFWDIVISIQFNGNLLPFIDELSKIRKSGSSSKIANLSSSLDRFLALLRYSLNFIEKSKET
jgi:hypothetical protein